MRRRHPGFRQRREIKNQRNKRPAQERLRQFAVLVIFGISLSVIVPLLLVTTRRITVRRSHRYRLAGAQTDKTARQTQYLRSPHSHDGEDGEQIFGGGGHDGRHSATGQAIGKVRLERSEIILPGRKVLPYTLTPCPPGQQRHVPLVPLK